MARGGRAGALPERAHGHGDPRRRHRGWRRPRAGLADRAPAALHGGNQRQAGRSDRRALSGACGRPRRSIHLSRPRPAGRLCDARPQAARRPTSAASWPRWRNGSSARLAAFNVAGERREDRIGVWVRRPDKGDGPRGQDRRHRHPGEALGQPARHRAQRRLRPVAFRRHRAVRHRRRHATASPACSISAMPASMAEVDMVLRREFEPLFGPSA